MSSLQTSFPYRARPEAPAFVAGEIAGPGPESAPVAEALTWMVRAGLVLRTRPDASWLDPRGPAAL